jgi:hypothetical protein
MNCAKPKDVLLQGAELLRPLFTEHGFAFELLGGGPSSGGEFAYAEYRKGERRIEFHFRHSLGMVTYHLGPDSISHEQYMFSVREKPSLSRYPGFSGDPLDAFRDLGGDIEAYCAEFLGGTNEEFHNRIEEARWRWAHRPKLPA